MSVLGKITFVLLGCAFVVVILAVVAYLALTPTRRGIDSPGKKKVIAKEEMRPYSSITKYYLVAEDRTVCDVSDAYYASVRIGDHSECPRGWRQPIK